MTQRPRHGQPSWATPPKRTAPPPTGFGIAVQPKAASARPMPVAPPATRFAGAVEPPPVVVQLAATRRVAAPPATRFGTVAQAKPAAAKTAPPPTRFGAARPPVGTAQSAVSGRPAAPPPTRFGPAAIQPARASGFRPPVVSTTIQPMNDDYDIERYGGGHSTKYFVVKSDWKTKVKKKSGRKIDKLFYSEDGVSSERSYDSQRRKQMLRWLSSLVFKAFPSGVEIQAYYHTDGNIYLSSNLTKVNKLIVAAFNGGVLSALTKTYKGGFTAFDQDFRQRIQAHGQKLLSNTINTGQEDVWSAIENNRIVVPLQDYTVDLHAERRIREHLGITLDSESLGGVKRACAVCAYDLDLVGEVNAGPLWPSSAALGGYDKDEMMDTVVDEGIHSHVTLSKRTKLKTTNYDSDSDSGTEDYL